MIRNNINRFSRAAIQGEGASSEPRALFYCELSPPTSHQQTFATPLSIRDLLHYSPLRAATLFHESYELLKMCFPDRNAIANSETLLSELNDPRSTFDIHVLTADRTVIGAINIRLLTCNDRGLGPVGAIEHLYTNPTVRGQGIGGQLVLHGESQMIARGAKLVLCELNAPLVMSDRAHDLDYHAGITAVKRRAFWRNRGFHGVDAPYIQPKTEHDTEEVHHMMVGIKFLTQKPLSQLSTNDYL